MDILVTGGCGFIGTALISRLLDLGHNVVNVDALTYAANPDKRPESASYKLVEGDVCEPEALDEAFFCRQFDAVIHMAAETHVDRSISGPADFARTNFIGTQVVLDAALKHDVGRFIHVSTDEVYGSLPLVGGDYFTEESLLAPSSPYSASKAAGDLLAMSYHKTFGLPVVVTRCSNNYGPFQNPEKFIPNCITKALRDERVPIYGDGKNVRDWIHVSDHARAIEMIAMTKDPFWPVAPGRIYNIGGACEIDNLSLAKSILHYIGKPESLIEFVEDRPGHDRRYGVRATRLQGLGWARKIDFVEGLKETVEWYSSVEGMDWVARAQRS